MIKIYNKQVLDHFNNPRNVGEIPDADGIGEVGNSHCGDMMWIFIKVSDDRITDIKFKTFGCAAAIATSSITTELVKGKTLDEALKFTNQSIVDALGGLPAPKTHCSLLAVDGLKDAIYDYFSRNKRDIPADLKSLHQRVIQEKEVAKNIHKS